MTPAEIEILLNGTHVKLYPYVRGHYPPETLYTLWRLMRAEKATEKIFWGRPGSDMMTPHQTRGDLVDFVKCFEPDPMIQRVLLLAQSQKHPEDVVGMFWFDDIVPGHRAAGSVFYRRKYWGEPAREASRLALHYGFEVLGVGSIWAYTPWLTGRRHAEAVGMRLVATLPGFVMIDGTLADLEILRVTREEFV